MDRMVQTALASLKGLQDLKFDLANNLANVNVPGFRKDLPNEGNAGFLSALNLRCWGDSRRVGFGLVRWWKVGVRL